MGDRIKILAIFSGFAGIIVSSSLAIEYKPQQEVLSSQICVERPENNGIVNIVPAEVVFSNQQRLSLVGGQAGCIFVAVGDYSFGVQSSDPYNPESPNPKAWISTETKVSLKIGAVAAFRVLPKADGATYVGGWVVESVH